MSLRVRKTLRLGRYAHITASGSGVSLGLGPRDASMNLSRRGVRSTIGVPGTGISYQRGHSWKSHSGRRGPVRSSHIGAVIVLFVVIWAIAKVFGAG